MATGRPRTATSCRNSSAALWEGRPRRPSSLLWVPPLMLEPEVAHRRVTFAPACRLESARWIVAPADGRVPIMISVTHHPGLAIYVRPSGSADAGDSQPR